MTSLPAVVCEAANECNVKPSTTVPHIRPFGGPKGRKRKKFWAPCLFFFCLQAGLHVAESSHCSHGPSPPAPQRHFVPVSSLTGLLGFNSPDAMKLTLGTAGGSI